MSIGMRLKQRLEELNLHQNQLATKLNISPSTLNGYFTGYREPDVKTLEKLSKELDVSVEFLITGNKVASNPKKEAPPPKSGEELLRDFFMKKIGRDPTQEEFLRLKDYAEIFVKSVDK